METTFKRPLQDIIHDLKKPLNKKWLQTKRRGGNTLTFMPWFRYCELADRYAPGWEKEVVEINMGKDFCVVRVRITIHAEEGSFSRESTGYEPLPVKGYGDPTSNAESMAFRRVWANFGLARELYETDDIDYDVSGDGASTAPPTPHMRKVKTAREKVQKVDVAAQKKDAEQKFEQMKQWAEGQIMQGKTLEYVKGTCLQKMIPKMENKDVQEKAEEWIENEWATA